jgi:hypothetical protein
VLEVLKGLELIETSPRIPRGEPKFNPVQPNSSTVRVGHERFRGPGPVRQIERYTPRNRGRGHFSGRKDQAEAGTGREPHNGNQNNQERGRESHTDRQSENSWEN